MMVSWNFCAMACLGDNRRPADRGQGRAVRRPLSRRPIVSASFGAHKIYARAGRTYESMVSLRSRRDALRLTGVGLAVGVAGCSSLLSSSGPRYSLTSSPRGGTTLLDLFEWDPRLATLHVRYHADALVSELLETGGLAVEAQPIGPYEPDGSPPPAYTEHEGAYYRIRVTDVEEVSLDRWEFWFEPVEDAPADATVVENPTEGLSALDADVVEWAVDDAIGAVVDDEDLASAPHGERGVVFFEPMDPDASALVPDPPFEYVRVDPDTEFLDEKQTLRARATRDTVAAKRYVHEAERAADSR